MDIFVRSLFSGDRETDSVFHLLVSDRSYYELRINTKSQIQVQVYLELQNLIPSFNYFIK